MERLTAPQLEHLHALKAAGPAGRGAYPRLSLATLNALERRGLARATRGLGSMAMPHTAIKWRLTWAGDQALKTQTLEATDASALDAPK